MNYNSACNILNLSLTFTDKELRQNYYIKALQYHPDKNIENNTTENFHKILDAYNHLKKYSDISKSDINHTNSSYSNILQQFMSGIIENNLDINNFLSILNNKYNEISINLLEQLPKSTIIQFNNFAKQYGEILNINIDVLNKLNVLSSIHTKNDTIITLNPSLDNLLNDEVYKLEYNNEIYCVPLWHHELIYEISNNFLIIQCEPDLPEYITLDTYNNLYINISLSVTSLLSQENLDICIGKNNYTIPIKELYLKKFQRYKIKGNGISFIDTKNIYNVENRANIYLDIRFIDIK